MTKDARPLCWLCLWTLTGALFLAGAAASQVDVSDAESTCVGDVDGDGDTDDVDLQLLQQAFGSVPGDPNWNPSADLDGDGDVDLDDLNILLDDLGCQGCAGDVDGDGDTDQIDLLLIEDAYGSVPGDPHWNPDADLDGDGVITQADIGIAQTDFGCGIPDCIGDIDHDGDVDNDDRALLLAAFGSSPGEPHWNPDADLDGSGTIDTADLQILLANFGCNRLCVGDLDRDRRTGQEDLGELLRAYLKTDAGDLNGDGSTDQADLGILLADYGCWVP
jgi:Dockerin type I domain